MRRKFFSVLGMSLITGTAGVVTAEIPVSTPVQTVAQQRTLAPRGASRPAVRRYRSYSIDPGVTGVPVPESAGVVNGEPSVVRPAPAAPRPTKPSYMRGDAKARGQFHR